MSGAARVGSTHLLLGLLISLRLLSLRLLSLLLVLCLDLTGKKQIG